MPANNVRKESTTVVKTIMWEDETLTKVGVPAPPEDNFNFRLTFAVGLSIAVNLIIWSSFAQVIRHKIAVQLPPASFKRIILPSPPKHLVLPKPKQVLQPILKTVVVPQPIVRAPRPQIVRPLQQPQHNQILTAAGPTSLVANAQPDGTAPIGRPIQTQGTGASQAAPQTPQLAPLPQPAPAAPPLAPPPPPKPAPPTGPTQDAVATYQPLPDIPDALKTDDYKSYVRVMVNIHPDSSFAVTLVSSSGNLDVDQLVLQTLKEWKWKPALVNGVPVENEQRFRFNFLVD